MALQTTTRGSDFVRRRWSLDHLGDSGRRRVEL